MPRTRRVDCTGPGIRRVRRGLGFSYHEETGKRIDDPETIDRITALAIPPAWREVWICPDPRGHVQATGYDDAGRKQYRYHDDWRAHRDRIKFDRMIDFGRSLPGLRSRVERGLGSRGLVFERVCSCAVGLLDLGLFRVGSERYESENDSYGLTTLKCRHLRLERGAAIFDYPAKGGARSRQRISAPQLLPTLRSLKRRGKPGDNLLVYRDGSEWRELGSEQVNAYIKEIAGEDFSAKDFRTWNGTVLCATLVAVNGEDADSRAARKRIAKGAVEETATYLGNTPAVCRASYIDPRLFDRFEEGLTIAPALGRIAGRADPGEFAEREAIERAVIRLLEPGG